MLKENKNSKLSNLDISLNNIGPAGAEAIANMLKVNLTLTALDFGRNGTGPQGAQSIADAIKVNSSLKTLQFTDATLSSSPMQAFGAIAASPASNSFSGCCIAASTASKFCSDRVYAKTSRISSPRDLHQVCPEFGTEKTAAKTGKFSSSKSCRKFVRNLRQNGRANGGRGEGEGVKRGEGNGHVTQRGGRVKGGEEGSWVE
eukprot:g12481.t1